MSEFGDITYQDAQELLTSKLQFEKRDVTGSHTVFSRPDEDLIIILNPAFRLLPQRQINYLMDTLDQHNVLSKKDFTAWQSGLVGPDHRQFEELYEAVREAADWFNGYLGWLDHKGKEAPEGSEQLYEMLNNLVEKNGGW